MRITSTLLAVCCCLSAVSGQWLETTIPVGEWPGLLCYNSVNNKVYCGSYCSDSDTITVIDGATNLVAAKIAVHPDACGLCYNPAANKVYCSYWNESTITVISGAGDSVITDIALQVCRGAMCCDSAGNKVYCGGDTGAVTVVCGAGDSVLAVLQAGADVEAACVSPEYRKVFCGSAFWPDPDSAYVIDCESDSVVAVLNISEAPTGMYYHTPNRCLYCLADYDHIVTVIDCATSQAVAWINVSGGQNSGCSAPLDNKVFVSASDAYVFVIDAGSNSVEDTLQFAGSPGALHYAPLNRKVYCANADSSSVTVIDAVTNDVVKTIAVGSRPQAFCYNSLQNRVYVANYHSASVSVIRDSVPAIEESFKPQAASPKPAATVVRGVLFLAASGEGRMANSGLLDITGCTVLDLHPGPNDVRALAPGVYFISERGTKNQELRTTTKVVIAR